MLNFRHILPFLLFTNCTAPFSEKEIPEREEGAYFYITVENPETKSLNGTIAENWEKKSTRHTSISFKLLPANFFICIP
jgi:hypothetical protein